MCVFFRDTATFARRSFFIFHLFKKDVGEEKKNEVPRRCWPSGGRTQNEHWPAPPPAIYSPGSKVPEPSRRGGGQGNHIDRTRLHKRLVVLTSRITEETRASGPNNGGHVSASTPEKREPGALRSLTSKTLRATVFFLRSHTFFRARVHKTKGGLSTKPVPSKFSPSKKTKNRRWFPRVYSLTDCPFISDQTRQEQNFISRCFNRAFFQRSTTL